jgi:hypothetical protein
MKITFNGQEFESLQSMPEDIRQEYLLLVQQVGDANQNGIPDIAEQGKGIAVTHRIVVNNQQYNSPAEMPPDVRELYEQAQSMSQGQTRSTFIKTTPGTFNYTFTLGSTSSKSWLRIGLLVLLVLIVLGWLFGDKFVEDFQPH